MPETVQIEITKPEAWTARGHSYPNTTDQWRALFRRRKELKLERAFIRIGSRILVDEARFIAATRAASVAGDKDQ